MKRMNRLMRTGLLMGLMAISLNSWTQSIWAEESKQIIKIEKPTINRESRVTYVAAAEIFRYLGKQVSWNQQKQQLIVEDGELIFTIGKTQVEMQKGNLYLSHSAYCKKGKVYIPLEFFAKGLGYHVSYKEGIITISGEEKLGQKGSYEEKLQEKYITISAAGDFTLGYYKGQARGGRFDEVASANGYTYFMKNVKSIFEKDDLTIANLEGPLTTRGIAAEKEFAIRGLPDYTKILKAGSIEVVNLANNHTYDYQKVGYDDTVGVLQKSKIGYFGEDCTYYQTINDIRVAIIGAKGWSNSLAVKQNLKKRIDEAKTKADLIIVEFHWGEERQNYPNAIQQDLAKYVIDQGVHLVLGSHPHVIQGIGHYKGANIVYSMGNFCFGANKNPNDKDTFIYQETFILTEDGIQSQSHKIIPCSISSTTSKNNYQPTPFSGEAKERVQSRLEKYSKHLKG